MHPALEGTGEGEGMLQGCREGTAQGDSVGPIASLCVLLVPVLAQAAVCIPICLSIMEISLFFLYSLGYLLLWCPYLCVLPALDAEMSLNSPIQAWMGLLSPNCWVWSGRMGPLVLSQLSWDSINLHFKKSKHSSLLRFLPVS